MSGLSYHRELRKRRGSRFESSGSATGAALPGGGLVSTILICRLISYRRHISNLRLEPMATTSHRNPHLLVHDHRDNVGVVVVENLQAGTELFVVITEDNSELAAVSNQDVPIGHKI